MWTRAEYDADATRVRSTSLKAMLSPQGPRDYFLRYVAPTIMAYMGPGYPPNNEVEKSDFLVFGDLFHRYLLEGQVNWFVYDGPVRRGKAWEAAQEENDGKVGLLSRDAHQLVRMRDAALANQRIRSLIDEDGFREKIFLWDDPDTGLPCKARVDLYHDTGVIVDLKTTRYRTPRAMMSQSQELRYEFSAAFYELGRLHDRGIPPGLPFWTIMVSKEPPYYSYAFPMAAQHLEIGHRDVRSALRMLADCRKHHDKLLAAGESPLYAWPDLVEVGQEEEIIPEDWWLAKRQYGYEKTSPENTTAEYFERFFGEAAK